MLKGEGVILWPSSAEGDKCRLRNDSRSPPLTGGRESEPRWARGSSKSCSKYCSKRSPSCTLRAKPGGAGLVCSHAGVAARPSSQPAPQLAARPGTFGKELQRKAATGTKEGFRVCRMLPGRGGGKTLGLLVLCCA